jgi:hypothetical protein
VAPVGLPEHEQRPSDSDTIDDNENDKDNDNKYNNQYNNEEESQNNNEFLSTCRRTQGVP